jgi:hypothetical protein
MDPRPLPLWTCHKKEYIKILVNFLLGKRCGEYKNVVKRKRDEKSSNNKQWKNDLFCAFSLVMDDMTPQTMHGGHGPSDSWSHGSSQVQRAAVQECCGATTLFKTADILTQV